MTIRPHQLARFIAESPALPRDKDRSEVRVYSTIITGGVLGSFVMTALYVWRLEPSPIKLVADLTHAAGPFALGFALLALAMVPHLVDLLFRPGHLRDKGPRKMAAGAMVVAAVLWGLLANRARPLDLGLIPLTYWATALGYLLVGGAYGYSLNAQLASEQDEKTPAVG